MMKLPVQLALLGTAGLLATSAFADTTILPVASTPSNSVYISGDAGYGVLSTPDQNPGSDNLGVASSSHSNGGFAGGVNIGLNHALSSNLLVGGEFGWASNGRAKYTETFTNGDENTLKITSTDLQLLATTTYLFNNGLNLFAKAGGARVQQQGTVSGSDFDNWNGVTTETRYQPMLAAGAGYQFRMVNLFVQYGHIFGKNAKEFNDLFNDDGSFNGTVAVDTIKAGVAVNFAL